MIFVLTFLGIIAITVLYLIKIYNALVSLRNAFKNAFKQIDIQLKRRYDLIPNLVEAVKGYMKFERETLEAVMKARNTAAAAAGQAALKPGDPKMMKDLVNAEAAMAATMGRLLAVVEAYPDLKANQEMARLMEELSSTENRVAFARQAYNDSVMIYNTAREQFPNVLISGPFGFTEAAFLDATTSPQEREAVKVSFT